MPKAILASKTAYNKSPQVDTPKKATPHHERPLAALYCRVSTSGQEEDGWTLDQSAYSPRVSRLRSSTETWEATEATCQQYRGETAIRPDRIFYGAWWYVRSVDGDAPRSESGTPDLPLRLPGNAEWSMAPNVCRLQIWSNGQGRCVSLWNPSPLVALSWNASGRRP
jgi:hypothetical protein